jgi:RNA polymerase sigma factor (sigma-70 family)
VTITPETLRTSAESRPSASIDVDRAVVVDVHERRGAELFGFARHLGLTDEEARDATQEALLRLWTAIDDGKAIDQPDAWVFRTLYRICMDHHRWRRRVRGLVERIGPPVARQEDRTTAIAVWDAVEQLPERQRLAIYLRYRADLPFDEIGGVLGIAPVSARSHVSRALAALRGALADSEVTS